MGITIHYSGRLRTTSDVEALTKSAEEFAALKNWRFEKLQRPLDSLEVGFITYPHPDCEPLRMEFDSNRKLSGWVKTQFAGPQVHIEIVSLLKQIKPFFVRLSVVDEGEYWKTRSEETLCWHINKINELIQEALDRNPTIRPKVRTAEGLITDYIE